MESEIAITASLLSQSLSVITGIVVSAGAIVAYVNWYLVLPVVLLALLFLYPPVFNRILNFFSGKLRKKSLRMDIRFGKEVLLFAGYILAWVMYGISFYFLFKAFSLNIGLIKATQFFAVSYLIGLFAVFVPGGLGVREGILTVLLRKSGMAGYVGSLIAIIERINVTVTEMVLGMYGLVRFLLKRKS